MRTIKFRVWDGKYMDYDVWVNSFGAFGYSEKKHNTPNIEISSYSKESIIMQFTGLHDKNGKEIYEGDIILFQKFSNWDDDSMKRHKATVIFKEGCFMWEILEFGKKSVTYYANATEPLRNTNSIWGLEVIGNIYENPELLENKLAD